MRDFLAKHRDAVLEYCTSEPYPAVKFGAYAQADWIVKEAATYIIARDISMRNPVEAETSGRYAGPFAHIQRKREQLSQGLREAELELYRLTPGPGLAGRLAIAYFRHCLSQHGASDTLQPGHAEAYRTISWPFMSSFNLDQAVATQHFGGLGAGGAKISYSSLEEAYDATLHARKARH